MRVVEVEKTLDSALKNLTVIDKTYFGSDYHGKRKLIGSMYPEKFTFEELEVRTAKKGEVFNLIYFINIKLHKNKNGQIDTIYDLSNAVIWIGFEPMALILEG